MEVDAFVEADFTVVFFDHISLNVPAPTVEDFRVTVATVVASISSVSSFEVSFGIVEIGSQGNW